MKKSIQILTQYNFMEFTTPESRMEKGGGASLCEPDQSMTVQEIIQRFASGQPLDINKQTFYGGEDLDQDFDPLQKIDVDIIDVHNYQRELENNIRSEAKKNKLTAEKSESEAKAEGSSVADDVQPKPKTNAPLTINREAADVEKK